MLTSAELSKHLRQLWIEKGFKPRKGQRVGVSVKQLVRHSIKRNRSIKVPYLELWIAILDELISWELSLAHLVFPKGKKNRLSDFERSTMMLLAKIISDSFSIRHLILIGYDVSARTILRSTAEYIDTFVAIVDDPPLAHQFVKTDSAEGANDFWRKHISRKSLQTKIDQAWARWFRGLPPEAAASFAGWGRQYNRKLSAMMHPSFAAGLFSVIPFKSKHSRESWLGIWGDKSDGSVDTIYIGIIPSRQVTTI